MKIWHNLYEEITTLESIFQAWDEFIKDKKKKQDVVEFTRHLEDNLFALYTSLLEKTYQHGGYKSFYVRDPKVRHISKAIVRDRVTHHLVSNVLEKVFDPTFYAHSYSCRKNKGTHKGVLSFSNQLRKLSKNNTSPAYVLKCDIKKFFASVDHAVLLDKLQKKIKDEDFLWLLREIVTSFRVEPSEAKGMPIGNLTSQFFANIYLDPFDKFIKNTVKAPYYIRYADDFALMADNKEYLEDLLPKIEKFLKDELNLSLHPNKVSIRDYYLGIDFLGYIVFPHFILPRTKTKKRILRKIRKKIVLFKENKVSAETLQQSLQSYLGYLSHADSFKFSQNLKNQVLFWLNT